MPDWVDFVLVELPGRGQRHSEPPFENFDDAIHSLSAQIRLEISGPMAFLGHSLGGLMAYETAKVVPGVLGLGISAIYPPVDGNLVAPIGLWKLDNEALIKGITKFGELPEELKNWPQFLDLYLDVIRADFKLLESYRLKSRAILQIPTMVFGGREDQVILSDKLDGWKQLTQVEGPVRLFGGDHFYISRQFPSVLELFLPMILPLCADK